MLRRSTFLAALGAVFALALPSAASASEVHISAADNLLFTDAPGHSGEITVEDDGAQLRVHDWEGVTAGPGCFQFNPDVALCPLAEFGNAYVSTEDGADRVYATTSHPIRIDGSETSSLVADNLGSGPATIVGGAGADDLASGASDDTLNGNGGNDQLYAGDGGDELNGGAGDDLLNPAYGSDEINGGADFDSVTYQDRDDPMKLSIDNVANDGVVGEMDNIRTDVERLVGGDGDDEIKGSSGPDVLVAREGNDTVRGGIGDDEIDGEGGNDDLRGDFDDDDIEGGAGDDEVDGSFGDDELDGGPGHDLVNGSLGEDQVFGGPDDDTLLGGTFDDHLSGDAGNDNLKGQGGADTLAGGIGTDTADYSQYTSPVTVDLDGSSFDDGIESEGDSVRADVENAIGGSAGDRLTGNGLQNVLTGGAGDDALFTADGTPDSVDCGLGNDTFDSDAVDTLTECEPPAVMPAGDGGDAGQPGGQDPADGGQPGPGALPALRIGPSSARVSRTRVVTLTVDCPAGVACAGTLRLQRTVKGQVRTLGTKRFSVPAGAKRKVRIKVTRGVAKSIARRPLRVNAVAGDASRKVTLKPAPRRKR